METKNYFPENTEPVEETQTINPELPEPVEAELVEDGLAQKIKKTIRGLILALVVLVPIFFLPFTSPTDALVINKQALIFGVTLVSLILWMAVVVRQGGARFKLSGLELGMGAFVGASLLSAIFSTQVYRSFMSSGGFLTMASLALFWFMTVNFFERKDFNKLADFFLLGSFLAILAGLLSIFGLPVLKWFSLNQLNTVGTVNSLGVLAAVSLVLVLAQYFNFFPESSSPRVGADFTMGTFGFLASAPPRSSLGRWFWSTVKILSVLASVILFVLLNWWIFYTAVMVAMVLVVLWPGIAQKLFGVRSKFKAVNLVGPMVILVLSLVLLLGSKYFSFNVPGRQNIPLEVSISQKGSAELMADSFSEKPVFGFGEGNFPLAFDKFKLQGLNNSLFWSYRFRDSASGFFNLSIELGVVGLAAFLFFLFLVFRAVFRKKQRLAEDLTGLTVSVTVFVAALALWFLYPFNLVLMFLFWFWAAVVAITLGEDNREVVVRINDASLSSVLSSLGFVVLLVFGLVGGYLFWQTYQAEAYFAKVSRISLSSSADIDKAVDILTKAVNVNQNDDRYLNGLGQLLLTRINNNLKDKAGKKEDLLTRIQNDLQAVTQIASRLMTLHPNDSISWSNAGFIYENLVSLVSGADNAAITAYSGHLKRAPYDPSIYVRIGNIYFNRAEQNSLALAGIKSKGQRVNNEKEVVDMITEDYSNAEENFKKAVELKGDLATALYSLGVVYEREAKIKDATKQLELIKLLNPNGPGLAFELGLLYYRDGQKDKALNEMARAVNLFKDYSNARWYLALMLEEKGQIDLAVGQLKEILKLDVNKDNKVVQDKLAALEAGKREIPPAKVTSKRPLEETRK